MNDKEITETELILMAGLMPGEHPSIGRVMAARAGLRPIGERTVNVYSRDEVNAALKSGLIDIKNSAKLVAQAGKDPIIEQSTKAELEAFEREVEEHLRGDGFNFSHQKTRHNSTVIM